MLTMVALGWFLLANYSGAKKYGTKEVNGQNKPVHCICKGGAHEEGDLVRHIHLMESMMFGQSADDVRCLA